MWHCPPFPWRMLEPADQHPRSVPPLASASALCCVNAPACLCDDPIALSLRNHVIDDAVLQFCNAAEARFA